MGEKNLQDMLVSYIRDAHAMEQNVARMLDAMIATTKDPEITAALQKHRSETERHEELLANRLTALGAEAGTAVKDIPAILGAVMKGLGDAVRSDKAGKNARDGYVTEAMEIAAYRLLEQLAERAGDAETAAMARDICGDEEAMRDLIEANWGKFIDLTLAEEGVTAGSS